VNGHVSEDLPRLLTGDAGRDEVMAAAAHLRECVDCQHELVSDVVAHASLRSAQRFAPENLARTVPSGGDDAAEPPGQDEDDAPLPDLSDVFAQVRRELAEPERTSARRKPGHRARWTAAAAAAVVVVAGGVTAYEITSSSSGPAGRTVQIGAYGVGRTSATAHVDGGNITVDAAALPDLDRKFYEVWLTNDARTAMQPVGWIGTDGVARISVRTGMLSKFPDLEVSVQDPAKGYQYSNVSVLRGSVV
jgi:anti-sigma-K factor RskA